MDSIRVWLEPDYDHGRTGVWLLDWPGAFTWGETRATALGRAVSAAHRHVDWLASHGEEVAAVPMGYTEIIEDVAAFTLPDGYEVNATFTADDRPVQRDELDAQVRRLAFARSDLLAIVDRAQEFQSNGGSIGLEERSTEAKVDGAADGRALDAVLRHVAGAETWFVSRLDPAARYSGPREGIAEYLAGSREFLVDGLARLHSEQAGSRVDSKTERWTLAKVLRRALYHSLDHLAELDRRLAIAEHQVDRITIRRDAPVPPAQLRRLLAAAGLTRRAHDTDEVLLKALSGSTLALSAWDGDELVGLARMLSDEATNAYVSTVAVAPRWQDRGLGSRLMSELIGDPSAVKVVLEAAPGAERFYERLGFQPAPTAMVRPRGVS